jgi:hydrogenase nickel incorporation protein HypB
VEIQIGRKVLEANDQMAQRNREEFRDLGLLVINLMSSPGAGKTTLLERTARMLKGELSLAVIEGDIQTTFDADRIAAQGVAAVQINTRGACHLEAASVREAAQSLDLERTDILFIENVGNLVCPAEFDLGEEARVTILSTPEGEDKPFKYPLMFRLSSALIINKIDLLPNLPFDLAKAEEEVRRIQPMIDIFQVAALTGEGMEGWLEWLKAGAARAKAGTAGRG